LGGIMIAVYYIHLFIGNNLVGYLGGFLDKMSGAQFWLMHAAIMGVATVLLLLARIFLGRFLVPTKADEAPAAA
jgi:POT family proton-dependent oligopeptide transporter